MMAWRTLLNATVLAWAVTGPWAAPEIVEWTAFPAPGEDHGPLCRRRWINWGSWFTIEPPPNHESPLFRADMEGRVGGARGAGVPGVAGRRGGVHGVHPG